MTEVFLGRSLLRSPIPKSQGGFVVAFAVAGFSGITAKKGALGQIIVQKLEKICNEGAQQGNMTAALQGEQEDFDSRDSFGFAS